MSDFMPVPPTYAVDDPQVRSVLEALAHNVQVSIDTFAVKSDVNTTVQSALNTAFGLPTYGSGGTVASILASISGFGVSLNQKLAADSSYVLKGVAQIANTGGIMAGSVTWDSTTGYVTGGSGVVFTENGITGVKGGSPTFAVTKSGDATFSGTVAAGAVIAGSVTLNSAGGDSLTLIATKAKDALPSASFGTTLQSALSAGVADILAGSGADYRLNVDTTNNRIIIAHKFAKYGGTTTSTGANRTGLALTANGLAMGYNDASTGVWTDAISISSLGDVNIKGTLTAGSVITGSVTVNGVTLAAISTNAGTALTNANAAYNLAASKLAAQSTYILGSDFSLKTSTYDSGSGIIITNTGILGRNNYATTFAIDNTGAATFAGDVVTSGRAVITGAGSTTSATYYGSFLTGLSSIPSATGVAAIYGRGKSQGIFGNNIGVWGEIDSSVNNGYGWGVLGISSGSVLSAGVYGFAGGQGGNGVSGITLGVNGNGLSGSNQSSGNNGSGTGLSVWGKFQWGPTSSAGMLQISPPDGGTDKYLRNDGTWAQVASLGGGTVTGVYGTGSVNGISLSGSVSTSGYLTLSGSVSIAASQVTSGTFPPSRMGSGGSGVLYSDGSSTSYSTAVVNTVITNSGNCVATGLAIGILGSTYTGIAGAYVNASGNANNVFLNVAATSPSDRRLKHEIDDCDLGLSFVNSLVPKKYKLKNDERQQLGYGFIADEVATLGVYGSSLVYHEANWQVGDITGFDTIHYPSYVAVLTKAIQELSAKVHALENANAT